MEAFVIYGDSDLTTNAKAILCEFVAQTLLIGRFKQPWPQRPMHLNRQSDNFPAEWVEFLIPFQFLPSFSSSW